MNKRLVSETSTRSGSIRTRGFTVTNGACRENLPATHIARGARIHDSEPNDVSAGTTGSPGRTRSGLHTQAPVVHALLLLVSALALVATAGSFGERTAEDGLAGHATREASHENAWYYRYSGGYDNARTYRF